MFRRGPRGSRVRSGLEESDRAESTDPIKQRSAARNTAIGLLSRREHAQAEIKRKLQERGYDDQVTTEVVDDLTRKRLLSDDRFAEMFIHARAARGQGPVRLRAELRQLRVPTELIERHLANAQVEWVELAVGLRHRKFGTKQPATMAERAKQVRFLQYRGFSAEQIRIALGTSCEDELLESGEGDEPLEHDREL